MPTIENKEFVKHLGFQPKENTKGILCKKYQSCGDYNIEIDFENESINFGNLIKSESKTTQNFSQKENWVVLECVNRLLEKGYQPENIVLEKTWATGHGTSGRLDILVNKPDGSAYLMIECKTWGTEFDKAQKKINKDGGQLFTYFQQDKNADVLMLYASTFDKSEVSYKNVIVKIEEDYRQTGNVKDLFERWNKLPKTNGIFENWATPYEYKSKAILKGNLKELKQEHSSFIFNRFLEILRHNVVSDKPNAFNKIFTLFLCKIVDEYSKNNEDELEFQWFEGKDTHITFQKRLTDLYNKGMRELLEKNVTDISDNELDKRFGQIDDKFRDEFKDILTEIRLKKNNEFAIKEVYDDDSFNENAKVVKEIVELLQEFRLRYNYRQQFLSDFFELLLTTGLKQESGQFFTPIPIARFILRSIPLNDITEKKLQEGNRNDLLPRIIDYAAGSGHFVTESMEDVQKYIDNSTDLDKYSPATKRALQKWKTDQFDWAEDYVYAIEKDYRLVKTAKVSCYLHGDGLAKVIHGDGLGDFSSSKDFKDLLSEADKTYTQDNKQFDVVVSNPPYSVSAFKGTMMEQKKAEEAFDLYNRLTDQSSEIECLFVERTKQLLKDGGVAGIILPSSILSNSGIYTQTREIIFKYFEIIAITELGNNTFMATGTNTVILFLRRRNNADWKNIYAAVEKYAINLQDITINGIETPVAKYVAHVWEGLTLNDYNTLLQKQPNETIQNHELYKEYTNKIKAKKEEEKLGVILKLETEKLFYFVLASPQKIILVKSGEKNAEKQFLGYEFSNRRGSEGIHPIQRSKSIDECTSLYDAMVFENPEKASTYIFKNFKGESDFEIHDNLKKNISQIGLVDMIAFDRVDFEKSVSLNIKRYIQFKSKYEQQRLGNITTLIKRGKSPKYGKSNVQIIKSGQARGFYDFDFSEKHFVSPDFILDERKLEKGDLLFNSSGVGTAGRVTGFFLDGDFVVDSHISILRFEKSKVLPKYALNIFGAIGFKNLETLALGQSGQIEVSTETLSNFKIPLPQKEIQEKIVAEIEELEKQGLKALKAIEQSKNKIFEFIEDGKSNKKPLKDFLSTINPNKNDTIKGLDDDTEVSFLSMPDVSNEAKIINLQKRFLKDVKKGFTFFQNDDILFAKITPCTENGKGAFVSDLNNNIGFGSTEFFVIRTDKTKLHPKLLFYITISKNFRTNAEKEMTGASGHRRVPKAFIESYQVSLPQLEEQKQIVSEIEKLESQIAGLEKQLATIPKQKEQILKKYLE